MFPRKIKPSIKKRSEGHIIRFVTYLTLLFSQPPNFWVIWILLQEHTLSSWQKQINKKPKQQQKTSIYWMPAMCTCTAKVLINYFYLIPTTKLWGWFFNYSFLLCSFSLWIHSFKKLFYFHFSERVVINATRFYLISE